MSDFLADILDAMDEVDEATGEPFVFGNQTILGNFTGALQGLVLTVTGGQSENVKGTLVVSRRRLPKRPALMSLITDPHGTRYRIADLLADGAAWTLTLTAPNGNSRH